MSSDKNDMNYASYLKLDQLLSAQELWSGTSGEPAHDEMLFIIVHQAYELWFKQIIHELSSAMMLLGGEKVDEMNVSNAVTRFQRIVAIQKLLVEQISIIETLTPLDFTSFRGYLPGASGFQSMQFRIIENKLGLRAEQRLQYGGCPYHSEYSDQDLQTILETETGPSLINLVEKWLERTPFLHHAQFNFLEQFINAFNQMNVTEMNAIQTSTIMSDKEKDLRNKMARQSNDYINRMLNEENYNQLKQEGKVRLSFQAFLAALFINVYREQPILHMPFQLLSSLLDIEEQMNLWRYRHSMMVMRMIGSKIGTGGSSGYAYLKETVTSHVIFSDFYTLSSFYIPRASLPKLPENFVKELGFYYNEG